MLASLKMTEARSKRMASAADSSTTVVTSQQQQAPPPPPQKRMRFTNLRIRPLGELLDGFPTDEHLLHALTRPATVDDYGGVDAFVQQLLNLALGSTATSAPAASQTQQTRPAAEIALRALRLVASSHSPLYSASVLQTIFERCLGQAQSLASVESASIRCSNLLAICAECAKSVVSLQQQLISVLIDILSKPDSEFVLLTESLRLLARFFARECANRHLTRLCAICVDLLMVGDVRVRLDTLDLLNEMLRRCSKSQSEQVPVESIYRSVLLVLDDGSEDIRLAGLSLAASLASLKPDLKFEEENGSTTKASAGSNTLANTVFSHLCHACASDRAIRVRALAARLMGQLPQVSENYIEQSLDKRTIASMRVDGASDPPQRRGYGVAIGDYEVDAVSVISQSACGALVHALEDEFYEVREAAIESLSRMITPDRMAFARQGQDFLIDALGDEVEIIVVCALRALARAGAQLDFTEKQVTAILFTLKVASPAVRRQVHKALSTIRLRSRVSHLACCLALTENIRMFPSDVDSIWTCCAHFGRNHPELTRANIARLIDIHPMFLSQETKMDDPTYIAKLLILFAAAGADGTASQIMRSLPEHVRSHWSYVCARFRHLLHEPSPNSSTALVHTRQTHLEGVIKRYIDLLRGALLSSPSFDRSIEVIANTMGSIGRPEAVTDDLSTAVTPVSHEQGSDRMSPQWRFVSAIIQCLFDYRRIRRITAANSADSLAQARAVLFSELRPRISRLVNCFMPIAPSVVSFLRLVDVAACSIVDVDPRLLHQVALLAREAFESGGLVMPNVVERAVLFAASRINNTLDAGSSLVPRVAQFDESLVATLIGCLSHDDALLPDNQRLRVTELHIEIREPVPLYSEPAAEVRFVSYFGACIPLRFIVTGFQRSQFPSTSNQPRVVVRVMYPNQRSDQLIPLASEVEVLDDVDDNETSSATFSLSVAMQIPIAFVASTGPCHARVSILLATRHDGLVDLTAVENGGSGPLQLLVHSRAAKGEMQKRLLAAHT